MPQNLERATVADPSASTIESENAKAAPDGRVHLFVILAVYFLCITGSSLLMPFDVFWDKIGVPAGSVFSDMHYITRDSESLLTGRSKIEGFFYPPACYWFGYLGVTEKHTFVLGVALVFSFFVVALLALGRVDRKHVAYYAALLCSPSIMLGVARGNIDLFVFILFVAALYLVNRARAARYGGYGLLFYAALLKLYPILSAPAILREKGWRWWCALGMLGAAFGLYILAMGDDFQKMYATAPRSPFLTFGAPVLFDRIWRNNPWNGALGLLGCAVTGAGAWMLAAYSEPVGVTMERDDDRRRLDFFRLGAFTYVVCFALVRYNYIYRHAFLLLTVPQWIVWRRSGGGLARISTIALTCLPLAFWLPRYVRNWWHLDQLADWTLLGLYVFALLITSSERARRVFFLQAE